MKINTREALRQKFKFVNIYSAFREINFFDFSKELPGGLLWNLGS